MQRRPKVGEVWRFEQGKENYKIIDYNPTRDTYTIKSLVDGYITEGYHGDHFDISWAWTLLFEQQVEHHGRYKLVDRGTHYETEEIP